MPPHGKLVWQAGRGRGSRQPREGDEDPQAEDVKEGILQELKRRRFYEKPSVKRKRKTREARKRLRREMKRKTGVGAPPRM